MRTPVAAGLLCVVVGAAVAQEPCAEGGYPLAVVPLDSVTDAVFLQAVARAAAYRWQVPSRERAQYANWQRVRRRTLPPEPRWADDWQPSSQHRAVWRVTIYRSGRWRAGDLITPSGDRDFDRSLRTIATDPMPAAPVVPPFPDVGPDSLRLELRFGSSIVDGPHGLIRFARGQTPVRLASAGGGFSVPRGPYTTRPTTRYAVVTYDVTETGDVRPGSFEILDASDREFGDALREYIQRQRFQPATQNCRPITMTVVQRAGT